ncbi:hypothetical protein A6R68_02810 [Neotoma lepida]|uniref:Small ribosomal subunit protein uS2 C-terminal domain-containing protein n=1 Tax=Neotoma lepida TaxID=56216 RepID=A0A1A6GQQ8_NEOLE|nr:hypothetical protein A6R68_02810 [Neotoma lepida]
MPNLYFYRDPEKVEKEEQATAEVCAVEEFGGIIRLHTAISEDQDFLDSSMPNELPCQNTAIHQEKP